jgi:hypothetical protein
MSTEDGDWVEERNANGARAKLLKRGLSLVSLSVGRSCVRLVWGQVVE